MVAALGLAAFGMYGLLRPGGGDAWRDGASVIIERESGARFVYRDGVLHPVLNYSSALLILGPATGPGPRAAGRVGGRAPGPRWASPAPPTCSRPRRSPARALDHLLPPAGTPAGRPPRQPSPCSSSVRRHRNPSRFVTAGLLARDANGGLHLLWNDRRYPITPSGPGLRRVRLVAAGGDAGRDRGAQCDSDGTDIGRLTTERANRESAVAGYKVGEVFVVSSSDGRRQFGVALAAGLAEVTQVQAGLLIADGSNGLGGRPIEMGQAQFASAPRAASLAPTGEAAPPATTPDLVPLTGSAGVCADSSDGAWRRRSRSPPGSRTADEIRLVARAEDARAVDSVVVPAGRGARVEALAGLGSPRGALSIVSDLGLRFPVASRQTLGLLGYGEVRPQRLPAALVALLPSGRALRTPPRRPRRPRHNGMAPVYPQVIHRLTFGSSSRLHPAATVSDVTHRICETINGARRAKGLRADRRGCHGRCPTTQAEAAVMAQVAARFNDVHGLLKTTLTNLMRGGGGGEGRLAGPGRNNISTGQCRLGTRPEADAASAEGDSGRDAALSGRTYAATDDTAASRMKVNNITCRSEGTTTCLTAHL